MGGGTELRWRAATASPARASTRIGLPEVKLGIYPGWGGSVRLPALVGAPAAFDMMLTGRALSASAARAIGLVDKVTDPALLVDAAVSLALKGTQRLFKQRFMAWASNSFAARKVLAPMLAKQVARKARRDHYPAPYALIDTWARVEMTSFCIEATSRPRQRCRPTELMMGGSLIVACRTIPRIGR
jgi:3-hydroxyacyl-CoA dehydrogenase/enoyl-CoA hydratase/3-hydroxybutyryl-CoA epimerase